ncbi:MAG: hypothetical protein WCW02_02640 [Candidatus Buchananbacteria bacterium]
MPQSCIELTTKLKSLEALKKEFDLELAKQESSDSKKSDDLALARDIKIKLELELREFQEIMKKIDWQDFYKKIFDLECDFSKVVIPEKKEGFDRLLIMAQGLAAYLLFSVTQRLNGRAPNPALTAINSFISDRTTVAPYAFWVRDEEVDVEFDGLSAKEIKDQGLVTETLEERLLHGLKYFKETGYNLDTLAGTLCAGSYFKDGSKVPPLITTPYVRSIGRTNPVIRIDMCRYDRCDTNLCARAVVV